MNIRLQSACLGSGFGFFVLYLLGMVVVAGFIPPPQPSLTADAITAFFDGRHFRILFGMSIAIIASPLYAVWGVAICGQMLRIERSRFPTLSCIQVISAGLGSVFFMLSPTVWLTLAFRHGHASGTVQILNDFAWLSWIVSWPFFFVQAIAFGLCVLCYRSTVIPRWVGYFSIWFAVSMIPASAVAFFYAGPLAWNGLFGIYVPLTFFAAWFIIATYFVLTAIKDESPGDSLGQPAHRGDLAARK